MVGDDGLTGSEAPRQPALVQPGRTVVREQEGSLRRDVRSNAGPGRNGDLVPARLCRPAGARIDQVMLDGPAASPRALRLAAGRDPAREQAQRAVARKADDRAAADSHVSAGGDEGIAGSQLQRRIDGQRLDHPVEVEHGARRTRKQASGET